MSDHCKCDTPRIVIACAVVVVCVSVGWFLFPVLMGAIGVSPTFTCHCIGGLIGLVGGLLFLRKFVF
jgi:hypothetical protein